MWEGCLRAHDGSMSTWYAAESIVSQHRADLTADASRTRLRRTATRRFRRHGLRPA